jgi:hypothetical protein
MVLGHDVAAVGGNDGLADRQAHAGSGHGRFALAADEQIEHLLDAIRRESGAVIADPDFEHDPLGPCSHLDTGTFRGILGRVLQQVADDALHQYRIEANQRQVRRDVNHKFPAREQVAQQARTGADDVHEGLPFTVQGDVAGLQSRHFEQVGQHVVHRVRLVPDHGGRLDRCRFQRRLLPGQGIGEADEAGQRGAQVVGQGRQYRGA